MKVPAMDTWKHGNVSQGGSFRYFVVHVHDSLRDAIDDPYVHGEKWTQGFRLLFEILPSQDTAARSELGNFCVMLFVLRK